MASMWLANLLLLAAVISLSYGRSRSCKWNLYRYGIIPTYANGVKTTNIKIVYVGNKKVNCGNRIPTAILAQKPKITFDATKKCTNATIIMFDPEVPEVSRPFLHWMMVNVNTQKLKEGNLDNGNEVVSYFPPGSMNHRYVFFVYCQSKEIHPSEDFLARFHFQLRKFAKRFGLRRRVIAANYLRPKVIPGVPDPVKRPMP